MFLGKWDNMNILGKRVLSIAIASLLVLAAFGDVGFVALAENNNETELELEIVTDEQDRLVNETIDFQVTADDEAVENATVWFNDQEEMTDADGNATLTFDEAGTFTVTAEKDDETVDNELWTYEDAEVEIEIEAEEIPGFTLITALLGILGALAAFIGIKNRQRNS